MFKKLLRNPFVIFFPFLCYYCYLIYKNKWPTLYGDEVRYVNFAKNLLHGFYSPPPPHIDLWNGPGYPIILTPFIALHVPEMYITMMNGLYLYLSLLLLYKALTLVANYKTAIVCCLLLAIYPNALAMLPILYTEAFTGLLVALFIYLATLGYIKGKKLYYSLAAITLGFLILTKVIFGYVVVLCIAFCLVMLLFKRYKTYYLSSVYTLLIAFALSVPYLVYTWHITGKIFYWGNSGGMSLYWMSTPYDNEYGDWKLPTLTNRQYPTLFKSAEVVAMLKKGHQAEVSAILKHNEIEQDELFKQAAINNIKAKPLKFFQNYLNNISRMLFNFPYSYSYQDAAIVRNIIIGSTILWASVIGIIFSVLNWRRIIFPVKLTLLVTGVYLLLSAALSAYPRQLDIVMPVLLFWIGYLASRLKKIEFKFPPEKVMES